VITPRAQLAVAKGIFRGAELSLRRFERTFCALQCFLRAIERHARGEAVGNESLLPLEGGFGDAKLGLRSGDRRARSIKIGLLFGWIEASQDIVGFDVGAHIDQAFEHAATDSKREIGAEAGLYLAGQRNGGLSLLRPHDCGAYESRRPLRGIVGTGTQRRGHERDSNPGTELPQIRRGGRSAGSEAGRVAVHRISLTILHYTV
jgi:hypothetical protein